MAGVRNRSRPTTIERGTKNVYGSIQNSVRTSKSGTCQDVVGYRELVNYFESKQDSVEGSQLFGDWSSPGYPLTWGGWFSSFSSGHLPSAPSPSYTTIQAAFNRAVAAANPSRAEVLVPAFIAELRDLPKLYHLAAGIDNYVQGLGRISKFNHQIDPTTSADWVLQQLRPTLGNGIHHSKKLAVANITLQFGIVPMIADIKSMLGVAMNIERRRREITQLYSGRGLRRRVNIQDDTAITVSNITLYSSEGAVFTVPVTKTAKRKTWVTMQWHPDNPKALPPLDVELWRTMMGITPSHIASAAWEVLPWSWFIDYFANTSDIIAGVTNSIGAHMSMGAIMQQTLVKASHGMARVVKRPSGQVCELTAGTVQRSTKQRNAMNVASTASLPILSGNQLSILGSLKLMGI